jgi:hypothetical protein
LASADRRGVLARHHTRDAPRTARCGATMHATDGDSGPWRDDALPCSAVEAIERVRAGEWLVSTNGERFIRWSELTADEQRWILCRRPYFSWYVRPASTHTAELPKLNDTDRRALAYIREHPGMSGDTIAKHVGVTSGHFRRSIVPKLKLYGITNDGTDGYRWSKPSV